MCGQPGRRIRGSDRRRGRHPAGRGSRPRCRAANRRRGAEVPRGPGQLVVGQPGLAQQALARFQVLLGLLAPSGAAQQADQRGAAPRVKAVQPDQAARVGQRLLGRTLGREPRHERPQHRRVLPARVLALRDAPSLEVRLRRQLESFQEFAADALRDRQQPLQRRGVERPDRGEVPQRVQVTANVLGGERHGFAVGEDARGASFRLVHQCAQLAEAPSQRATRVVGHLP